MMNKSEGRLYRLCFFTMKVRLQCLRGFEGIVNVVHSIMVRLYLLEYIHNNSIYILGVTIRKIRRGHIGEKKVYVLVCGPPYHFNISLSNSNLSNSNYVVPKGQYSTH